MNMVKYRMLLDKKIDHFAKENFDKICESDSSLELNRNQNKIDLADEKLREKERINQKAYFGITDFEKEFLLERKLAMASY